MDKFFVCLCFNFCMFYVLYWTFCTTFVYFISVLIQLMAAIRNKQPFIHSCGLQVTVTVSTDTDIYTAQNLS